MGLNQKLEALEQSRCDAEDGKPTAYTFVLKDSDSMDNIAYLCMDCALEAVATPHLWDDEGGFILATFEQEPK